MFTEICGKLSIYLTLHPTTSNFALFYRGGQLIEKCTQYILYTVDFKTSYIYSLAAKKISPKVKASPTDRKSKLCLSNLRENWTKLEVRCPELSQRDLGIPNTENAG